MPSITVRNVPPDTRDELAARAARAGQSLQGFLRAELIKLARRPDAEAIVAGIRARKRRTHTHLDADEILALRGADRRRR
jgi:plasmid stability protein